MTIKPMPWIIRRLTPAWVKGVTIPPFGIYIKKDYLNDARLIAHEKIHWRQYKEMGLIKFWWKYWVGLLQYGYTQHPMEIEAYRES